jgi:hypothetical protein
LGLSDLAGLFSRKFVIGFFIPVFFAPLAWAQLVDSRTMPGVYRDASQGTQILILGGFAVLVGPDPQPNDCAAREGAVSPGRPNARAMGPRVPVAV